MNFAQQLAVPSIRNMICNADAHRPAVPISSGGGSTSDLPRMSEDRMRRKKPIGGVLTSCF